MTAVSAETSAILTFGEHFGALEDPRVEWTKQHPPLSIVTIARCSGFRAEQADHANLLTCPRSHSNQQMLIETVHSMLTRVRQLKRQAHRVWRYLQARLAYTMAALNLLVSWHGLHPRPGGFCLLSIAQFSL